MARAAATTRAPSLRRRYFARFLLTGEIYGRTFRSQRCFLAATASRPSADREEAMRRDHTPVVWLATEGKDPQVFTLSLLVVPQQVESGTARRDFWKERALLPHRHECSCLAVQFEDLAYRV
jgi:hypothetical protein